ncbi:hemolysin family protein [Alphaproteobacteria bacterium]|nr:hemolysin family protein [Alphaproteobacteria bacterium]
MIDAPTKKDNNESIESDSVTPFRRALGELLRSIGVKRNDNGGTTSNLRELIEQHEEEQGDLDEESKILLANLLTFGDLRVNDVMIPRADIIALDISSSLDEIVSVFQTESHSRIPVYKEKLDDVVGVVNIKDLFTYWKNQEKFNLNSVLHEPLFVPPSMPVPDLLLTMRTRHIHMALVVDEYGGTDGLVTIEDLVESIVGDIEDEHYELEKPLLEKLPDDTIDASGRALTTAVESLLGVDFLPEDLDEDIETVAGVVAALAGRVPQKGEIIKHKGGFEFEITQADARRVKRLLIRKV